MLPIFINLDFFVLAGEIFLITPLADINKIIIDKRKEINKIISI